MHQVSTTLMHIMVPSSEENIMRNETIVMDRSALMQDPIVRSMSSWCGNYIPRTYNDAKVAWGSVARLGSGPADKADILHEVCLFGGGRLMAVRAAGGLKVIAVLSMD